MTSRIVLFMVLTGIGLGTCAPASTPANFPARSVKNIFKTAGQDLRTGIFKDCQERWEAGEMIPGVYTIYPSGSKPSLQVYCNHGVNATFTVIQRQIYGREDFRRTWFDYAHGFGNPQGDYWAGLTHIHYLTNTGNNILKIDMQDWHSTTTRSATYQHFLVLDEAHYFQMFVSGFSGSVIDDLSYQNGMYFFTHDRPDINHCAVHQGAGWWYNYCAYALPNGRYYPNGPYTPPGGFYDGIYWKDWLGYGYSLKFISMSLQRNADVKTVVGKENGVLKFKPGH